MSSALPPPVQEVLSAYLGLVQHSMPGMLAGLYLHGSLALGAYNPRYSDIDFIAITERRCTSDELARLRTLHLALIQRYPRMQLEGSYLQWHDLGGTQESIAPHPHIHDGILHPRGYHDINGVTWWLLKHRGITLIGPPPSQLGIQVDWDDLIAKMHTNLNSYWASFTTDPRRMAWLYSDDGIQWAVLGVLRQFYSFREGSIISKTGAGIYGLAHTPQRWQRLIQEAIVLREQPAARSAYRSRIVRALEARAFLQLIIAARGGRAP